MHGVNGGVKERSVEGESGRASELLIALPYCDACVSHFFKILMSNTTNKVGPKVFAGSVEDTPAVKVIGSCLLCRAEVQAHTLRERSVLFNTQNHACVECEGSGTQFEKENVLFTTRTRRIR